MKAFSKKINKEQKKGINGDSHRRRRLSIAAATKTATHSKIKIYLAIRGTLNFPIIFNNEKKPVDLIILILSQDRCTVIRAICGANNKTDVRTRTSNSHRRRGYIIVNLLDKEKKKKYVIPFEKEHELAVNVSSTQYECKMNCVRQGKLTTKGKEGEHEYISAELPDTFSIHLSLDTPCV